MSTHTTPTILLVPGLRDHVPQHWQTLLEARLPNARSVAPLEHNKLDRAARVAALNDALTAIDGPVILVAHSAGAMITVHWALQASAERLRQIHGALLATPADLDTPMPAGYPDRDTLGDNGWLPIPSARLPFPSILAASSNDPLCSPARAAAMANDWGSRYHALGAVGHLNPAAGYGEWPDAEALIRELY